MKKLFFGFLLFSQIVFAQERTMSIQHQSSGPSYFKVSVQDDGLLRGNYQGWCADWNRRIEDNVVYNARFYSSVSTNLPGDVVDHPEYLDEVNWIFNQNFVGKNSPAGLGVYTLGDVQLAIWSLIDDEFDSSTVGPFSQARVDEIVARAKTEGANYNPGCRQLVGIILVPSTSDGSRTQNTIILVPRYHFPKCVVPEGDTKSI
ncbi:MAG: hypothetical protein AB7I27_13420 [Bacteriovoracaceae bacterium]